MAQETNKITKKEREAYSLVGSLGGKATFKKRGSKHFSEIGKRGAKNRWSKKIR